MVQLSVQDSWGAQTMAELNHCAHDAGRHAKEHIVEVFAENARKLRLSRGMTQDEVGEIVGVHRSTICKLESGYRAMRIDTAVKYAEALGVPLFLLLIPNAKDAVVLAGGKRYEWPKS